MQPIGCHTNKNNHHQISCSVSEQLEEESYEAASNLEVHSANVRATDVV